MPVLAEIPHGAYWSTPFARWQGSLQHLDSIRFAAWVTRRELDKREVEAAAIDLGVLGMTVPQYQSFYGAPWYLGLAGLGHATGPTVSQACATGVRSLCMASDELMRGNARVTLVTTVDRCSNGPHVYYPAPRAPGGTGSSEDWVLDNFSCDPLGQHSMLQTAENVAARHRVTTAEQHDVVLMRYAQYQQALADERAFQRRYMSLPFEVPSHDFRKISSELEGDEGIVETSAEGLANLKPVLPSGSVTYGGQTHPADGNCSVLVTAPGAARALARDPGITIEILGYGQARTELAYMPEATLPASHQALLQAGIELSGVDTVKSHNPFAVNDIVFSRDTGWPLQKMNNFGCSLIWGHPQGPTGLRSIIEMIEELVQRGGGTGLFQGCAAGDSAMAVVLRVRS